MQEQIGTTQKLSGVTHISTEHFNVPCKQDVLEGNFLNIYHGPKDGQRAVK